MTLHANLISEIARAVGDLVRGDLRSLSQDGRIGRLTEKELAQAIEEYGRTLVEIPEEGWALADSYEVEGKRDMWAIDLPLWTREEGRSDLTLSMTLTNDPKGHVTLRIDDLHVL